MSAHPPSKPVSPLLPGEGRLIAHRQLLARLVAHLSVLGHSDLLEWLEDQSVYRDGQEDPGAVADCGIEVELAQADEIRLLLRLVESLMKTDASHRRGIGSGHPPGTP